MNKKELAAAKWIEKNYNLKSLKGQRIDISNFPEYKRWEGQDVYIEIGPTGSIKNIRQISQAELRQEKEAEIKKARELEDKKILSDIIAGEKKEELKKERKESRYQQKLRKDKEFREDEYLNAKMELQSTYAELISKDDGEYDPEDKITEAGSLNTKYYDLLNKVKIKERALQRKARAIEAAGDSTVYSDAVNTIKTLLGNDVNFSAYAPEEPKEDPSTPEKPIPDISARLQEAHQSTASATGDKWDRRIDRQSNMPIGNDAEPIKTQSQPLPKILQPKKSTQDAKRKIEEEELNKLLGR